MNIFLDSDVMLDVSLKREHFASTAQLLQHGKLGHLFLYTSSVALTNLHYVVSRSKGKKHAVTVVHDWLQQVSVVSTTKTMLSKALEYKMNDWEDAVQLVTAIGGDCDYLVTRNVKDYTHRSKVRIVTPDEMLVLVGGSMIKRAGSRHSD